MSQLNPGIKGRDIVMVGLQPWYFKTGCNAKNIANLLALHNRVLYVNVPIKRNAYYAKEPDPKLLPHIELRRAGGEPLQQLGQNLWEFYPESLIESVNWLPSTAAFRLLDHVNNRRFAANIRAAMKTLGFSNIILFNDNDIYNGFYLKELLKPSVYIYYFRDWLQGFSYWKKHATILEPELIRKSDVVLTNSLWFNQYSAGINPRTYYMGQGCDFDHFDPQKIAPTPPEDITPIPRPIIGYIGALDSERLSIDTIVLIAKSDPSWSIALVGPEDDAFLQSPLHQIPNVHFLGRKPFEQLASYVNTFDVCINPQQKNEITRGNYPLKIDEYLAMGKPVVATRTVAMELFKEHTFLANQPEDYPGLIQQALETNTAEEMRERIRFARTHSWENCMIPFYQSIIDFERQKQEHKIV
jgi:teichuronic acid biosynthesis glycosyltransferase TuaH